MECIRKRRDRYADRYAYVVYANLLRVLTNIAIFVTSKGQARDSRQVPNGRQRPPSIPSPANQL
jgi:hypothetical protein